MNPTTPEGWADAVDAAYAALVVARARDYGFVATGDMTINVERCEEVLRIGKALGYHPNPSVLVTLANGMAEEGHAEELLAVLRNVADEARA